MSRKSIVKPSQKSPRLSRRRNDASRPDSSSPPGARKAASAAELDAAMRSPSASPRKERPSRRPHSKTKSTRKSPTTGSSSRTRSLLLRSPPRPKSPVKPSASRSKSPVQISPPGPKSPTQRSPTGSKSPKRDSPTKRTRSRTPPASLGSPRSSTSRRSPRKRTITLKSLIGKESPIKEIATLTSPPKRKHSKSPKRPDSLSLSGATPEYVSGQNTPFPKPLRRLKEYTTKKVQEIIGPSKSKESGGGKPYVFLPTTEGLDRDLLCEVMAQLYGYMRALTAPSDEGEEDSSASLELVVLDIRDFPIKEDPDTETITAGVSNLGYVSSTSAQNTPAATTSSSSSSKSKVAEGVSRSKLEPWMRTQSADAAIGGSTSKEAPSKSATASPAKTSKSRPPLLRQRRVFFDSTSDLSIQMFELLDPPVQGARGEDAPVVPDPNPVKRRRSKDSEPETKGKDAPVSSHTSPVKRRHSKEKDPDAKGDASRDEPSSKPARKKSFDGSSRTPAAAAATTETQEMNPPKPARVVPDPHQPGTSGYRDVRQSIESEEDAYELRYRAESPESRNDYRDWCSESYDVSDGLSTQSWTPSWSDVLSSLNRETCIIPWCYRMFVKAFNKKTASMQDFFQHLSEDLVEKIRRPGQSATRRYVLIAGLTIWMLVREASHDYWFLCGRGPGTSSPDSPPVMCTPAHTLELLEPVHTPDEPPQTKKAKKAAKKAQKKMKREEASSKKKTEPTPEERAERIRSLMEIIRARTPIGPISPRRDFTSFNIPFITVSSEADAPADEESSAVSGEPQDETKPTTSPSTVPERQITLEKND